MTRIAGNDGALARAAAQPPIPAESALAGQADTFETTVIPFDAPTETSFEAVLRTIATTPAQSAGRRSPAGSTAAGQPVAGIAGQPPGLAMLGNVLGSAIATSLNPGSGASQTASSQGTSNAVPWLPGSTASNPGGASQTSAPSQGTASGVPWLPISTTPATAAADQSSTQASMPWSTQALVTSGIRAAGQAASQVPAQASGQVVGQNATPAASPAIGPGQGQQSTQTQPVPTGQSQGQVSTTPMAPPSDQTLGQGSAVTTPATTGQIPGQSSIEATTPWATQSAMAPFTPQVMGMMPMGYMLVPVFAMEPMGLSGMPYQLGSAYSLGQGGPLNNLTAGATAGITTPLRQPFQGSFPITQPFGPTSSTLEPPYEGYSHFHTGIDFGTPSGTAIVAAGSGTVVAAGWSPDGFGNEVIIDHGNGMRTLYGHLSQVNVSVGQTIQAGQQLGLSGSTGNSTGPHLHFGVEKNGTWIDPAPYLGTSGTASTASANPGMGFGGLPYTLLSPYQGFSLNQAIPHTSSLPYADPATLSAASQASVGSMPGAAPAGASPGQSTGSASVDSLIQRVAAETNVPASLIASVVHAESGGNPQAESPVGAKGLMQLMDTTAASYGVTNSFDPLQNLTAGARYLRSLLDQFQGNEQLAVAAYNAGPGAVTQYGGVPPFPETQSYVQNVLAYQRQISGQ